MKPKPTNEFVKKIEKLGYIEEKRNNGGHRIFTRKNSPTLAIPNHRKLSPGVQRNLEKLIAIAS